MPSSPGWLCSPIPNRVLRPIVVSLVSDWFGHLMAGFRYHLNAEMMCSRLRVAYEAASFFNVPYSHAV
jgi:hypothetical protein